MQAVPYIAAAAAVAGLVLAAFFFGVVKKASPGDARMVELMEAIQEGSRAFLRREYRAVAIFIAVMFVVIAVALPNGYWTDHGLQGFLDPYRRFREC